MSSGFISGPHIAVPRMPQVDHIKISEDMTGHAKAVDWITAPEIGIKVVISLVFVDAGRSLADVMDVAREGDYMQLSNSERVYVLCQFDPLSHVV